MEPGVGHGWEACGGGRQIVLGPLVYDGAEKTVVRRSRKNVVGKGKRGLGRHGEDNFSEPDKNIRPFRRVAQGGRPTRGVRDIFRPPCLGDFEVGGESAVVRAGFGGSNRGVGVEKYTTADFVVKGVCFANR